MKVTLHPAQYQIASDKHRFKVICAGRRFGKSVLARMIMLKWAISQEGLYWIVAPTFQQGKDIHWFQGFKREIPDKYVVKWNDSELSVDIKVVNDNREVIGQSRIQIKSADSPDRLKGVKLRGLIVDEIATMKNWNWIWQEALRPTLTDFQAPAIFISTPKGYNHFYDLFNIKNKNYKSFKFTSYDNPHIPKGEIDEARDTSTEDYFAQEYLADFKKYTGLVYKDFSRDLVREIDDFKGVYWIRGCDRGFTNPSAVCYIRVDKDDNWYLVDEIYKTKLTNNELSQLLVNMDEKYQIKEFEMSTMDNAQAGDIAELQQLGHNFIPCSKESGEVNKSYIAWKIQKLTERLKRGKLFVHPRCENTIREFEYYRYPENKDDLNDKEEPEKVNDHMMDALGDLNSFYEHFYDIKTDPFKDKIPGTYVKSYPDKIDEKEEDIEEELNIQDLW
jgi:phage terminase large subunit